jgi:coenzyme F420-reducing hydrogenase gamma subunit
VSDKPRVAFFDFACCEGCQLTVLSIGEPLIQLLEQVEVVTWREAISEQSDEFDLAVVEGSITRDSDVPRLKLIRERARAVVGLGACANLGGVQGLGNKWPKPELLQLVYGEAGAQFEAGEVRPISAEIAVDIAIHGCPIDASEFVAVMEHVLLGRPYRQPNEAVCYECKLNQYECVYDRGEMCLGPVTRCGCDAICISKGHRCFGCRGIMDQVNLYAARDVLQEHGLRVEDILGMFEIYSLRADPAKMIAEAEAQAKQVRRAEPWRFGSTTSLG